MRLKLSIFLQKKEKEVQDLYLWHITPTYSLFISPPLGCRYDKGSWLLPVALVPFLGPALYLVLRPTLTVVPFSFPRD